MRMRTAVAGMFVMLAAATSVHAQDGMGGMKMDHAQAEKMMASWPKASKDAVMYMMDKYGAPKEMTASMVMWGKTGPWKQTVVYNYERQHNFPGPHTDVMQQWIDYRLNPEDADNLAQYDGSVVFDRTGGELSARCDKEAANFLAINLAHEVAMKKRTIESARKMYGAEIMKMKAGTMTPYTSGLMFTPKMSGTADPDMPVK